MSPNEFIFIVEGNPELIFYTYIFIYNVHDGPSAQKKVLNHSLSLSVTIKDTVCVFVPFTQKVTCSA